MVECYVSLGSNVGDRVGMITRALVCLSCRPDIVLRETSHLYMTPAWGYRSQPDFLNAVCRLDTHLGPRDLLGRLKEIEAGLGRRERFRWGPREIDLDLLFYGEEIVRESDLRIPHPLLCRRPFVLVPLAEIAPDLIHPESGLKISQHLDAISGRESQCRNLGI